MRFLILGCGYIGQALARSWMQQGHAVTGVVQTHESAQKISREGISSVMADCSTPEGACTACDGNWDGVVFCVSSRGGDYQQTYVEGMRQSLQALDSQRLKFFIYTGSTSVYAQTDGGWVGETSETIPESENSRALLEAENILLDQAKGRFPAMVLRVSAIYGPGRHAWLDRLRDGVAELPGKGDRWMNQVHRDDLVKAILHLTREPERMPSIMNVTDDLPVLQRDYLAWLSGKLGKTPPLFTGKEESISRRNPMGRTANRRISNERLKSLGWEPGHPDFRMGMNGLFSV